jgi:hypothetical protein
MTDTNPRPLLAHAHEEADAYLMRKVLSGDIEPEVAKGLRTDGFLVATRTLSDLRNRDGLSAQAITDAFQRRLDRAHANHDGRSIVAAEFALAVWDGMQRDLAEYLSGAV